jgi:beta-mannanase
MTLSIKDLPIYKAKLLPSATSTPTATLMPTATPTQTMTPTPTEIPVLCGSSATQVVAIPFLNTGNSFEKFEPPDGQSYFGFTFKLWDTVPLSDNAVWGDVRPFAERICDSVNTELAGKTPTIIKVQIPWNHPFSDAKSDIAMIHSVLGTTVVPMLEWQGDSVTTKDIASGNLDGYIRQFARDVKEYKQPLFIRLICGEFNGSWWAFCSPKANPALTVQDFVDAWRRVVDIFRQEGVTNIALVWTPVTPTPPGFDWGRDENWQAYYPGDDYVDWVGADLYPWGEPAWLEPVYQFGLAHNKPFFLAEFGIRQEETSLTHQQHIQWLKDVFNYVESHPRIKVVLYFNYRTSPDKNLNSTDHVYLYDSQVSYAPDVNDNDFRLIAGGADIRELFATKISSSRYISEIVLFP